MTRADHNDFGNFIEIQFLPVFSLNHRFCGVSHKLRGAKMNGKRLATLVRVYVFLKKLLNKFLPTWAKLVQKHAHSLGASNFESYFKAFSSNILNCDMSPIAVL